MVLVPPFHPPIPFQKAGEDDAEGLHGQENSAVPVEPGDSRSGARLSFLGKAAQEGGMPLLGHPGPLISLIRCTEYPPGRHSCPWRMNRVRSSIKSPERVDRTGFGAPRHPPGSAENDLFKRIEFRDLICYRHPW